jgi:AraC family carnitine catabolism transcriptional activator
VTAPERIGFLLYPRFSMLALFCALEPLRIANRVSGGDIFSWTFITADGHPAAASNAIPVAPGYALADAPKLPLLIVVSSFDPEAAVGPRDHAHLRALARHGTWLGGIDTGPVILARAGLLNGFRATLHWESLPAFQEDFPDTRVSGTLFEFDRTRLTCAGGTAGADMMLHLIRLRHGQALAQAVADQMVHQGIRDAQGPQRVQSSLRGGAAEPAVMKAVGLMENHLEEPLPIDGLARRLGLTERRMERLFRKHLKETPSRFYVNLRLERARRLLTDSRRPVAEVGLLCGFNSPAYFSRAYRARFGRSPSEERRSGGGPVLDRIGS